MAGWEAHQQGTPDPFFAEQRQGGLMAGWGTRYLIIAVGDAHEPVTDEDMEAALTLVKTPLKVTVLDQHESDVVTVALLRAKGMM